MRNPGLASAWLAAVLAVAACGMKADAAQFPAPTDAASEVQASTLGGQGEALAATLRGYLRGRYTIASVRYFTLDGRVPWNAVDRFVGSKMREAGRQSEARPEDEDDIFTADVYPDGDGGFAVIMADAPLADGRKLVAYAQLAKAGAK